MAAPIKAKYMVNKVTLYNYFRDLNTGETSYYRTNLERTRIMTKTLSIAAATGGFTQVLATQLLVDPVTSKAYLLDEQGNKPGKKYVEPDQWRHLSADDKAKYWTLQGQDLIVSREIIDEIIDVDNFKEIHIPYEINVVTPILDIPGNAHHWQVNLV